MKRKTIRTIAMMTALGCCSCPVLATDGATSEVPGKVPAGVQVAEEYTHLLPRLGDDAIATRVTMKAGKGITVSRNEGDDVRGVYITWYSAPAQLTVVRKGADGKPLKKERIAGESHRQYFEMGQDCTELQISSQKGEYTPAEVRVIHAGETVPFSGTEADVLVFVPAPGDEYTLYGGLLPRLVKNGYRVQLVYMEKGDRQTEEESLKALERLGVDVMPVFWGLSAPRNADTAAQAKAWKLELKKRSAAKLIETVAPKLVIAPSDAEGSGLPLGACAAGSIAAEGTEKANLAEKPALYLAGTAGTATIDWTADDAHDTAESLYASFDTQWIYHRALPETLSFADGADLSPFKAGTPAPVTHEQTEPEGAENGDDLWFRRAGEPAEVVEADVEKGVWSYRSDTLSVTVERHEEPETPLVWHVAHIRMRERNSFRSVIAADIGKQPRLRAWRMARKQKAVLLITGDNLTTSETPVKGMLIRNDRFYADRGYEDSMYFDDGLGMTIIPRKTLDGMETLEGGIRDVYSFGPVLVEDGEIQWEKIERHRVANNGNPRCGVGMVEPGHLVAIVVDGRQKEFSEGVDLRRFARMFLDEGCSLAYNLDGGGSTAMVFMGENLNQHGGQSWDKQRFLPEALMWGYSELVPTEDEPVSNIGNGWGNLKDIKA
ncbi:MAG: phosphodiester glycosidase family protein [Clostridia bacterium]|nr:phosphodiester glycosidase family protein [Clostridia bacterium]